MEKESILPLVITGIAVAVLAFAALWYSDANRSASSRQESTSTTPSVATSTASSTTAASLPFLPIEADINQAVSDTQWTAGKTAKIKWMATVPWNASGDNPNVDQGLFAIELVSPGGTSLAIASGTAKKFMTTEGDIYSHFEIGYAVPANRTPGTYSVVIHQYLGGYEQTGMWLVTISSSAIK